MKKQMIAICTATVLIGSVIGIQSITKADRSETLSPQSSQQQMSKSEMVIISKETSATFRNIKADQIEQFMLTGKASVFEGTYQYVVKQGERVIMKGFGTASQGGPEWGKISQNISIPKSKLSGKEPLIVEIFEIDQESGAVVNNLAAPLNASETRNNQVFRKIKLTPAIKTTTEYIVTGQASVFEGTYQYAVKQGESVIVKGFGTASQGGPEWGEISQNISIPTNKLSGNQSLTLELYEIDQESGAVVNKHTVPLNVINKVDNQAFRNIKVAPATKITTEFSVSGEASVFEGTYQYVMKQGERVIGKGFGTASQGGPEWGTISQTISIPNSKLSSKQSLTLELFEVDQESGAIVNKLIAPLNVSQTVNNHVFRNIKLVPTIKTTIDYAVTGEASVFEGTYQYSVKQGERVIVNGFGTASQSGPEWGTISQNISIPTSKLSSNQSLTLELYEIDQESGAVVNKLSLSLK
ncbi:Gmad2 immunoglobulin-like domain-containing protein [Paenibacillus macquariensis]|uniref:Adhesin HecA family 20-residue repeat-containing protein n=1 Tax=Paenibacillus macquariensis TaxID=948756 RepID=A0ABY1KGR2_9BACL|nr:Gmad2 immunoglobulin-like domain-containing protein [Paenibacillus macquariensis]MEC0093172.1 Gmad2 immunoglobulin-like domain-containing protein [Paenibacillus macquariensis]SIR71753.1 adhesin HecA family 20-residue repeat-containing protein [Paenibacillus macquariensis]